MPDTKLYDILEVQRDATDADIKRAYRRLAREFHPDKNPNEQDGEKFKKLNFAHSVLTDPQKRAVYDREGLQGLRDGLSSGLFGEPPGTSEQQLYNVEDILCDLLTEVLKSLRLEFTEGGVQEFTRGALRLSSALYRRDFISSISETFKLSVQLYKALPSRSDAPEPPR